MDSSTFLLPCKPTCSIPTYTHTRNIHKYNLSLYSVTCSDDSRNSMHRRPCYSEDKKAVLVQVTTPKEDWYLSKICPTL